MTKVALTIAGSDPSGGAGIQADLKTFHQFGVYGMGVITLLTVQNTQTVSKVQIMDPALVKAQIEALLDDIAPQAVKTGALGNAVVIEAVASCAERFNCPLIVDPVLISKHGAVLADETALEKLVKRLLPLAYLVTPNLEEAAVLSGIEYTGPASVPLMAEAILKLGPAAVLVKGGHRLDSAEDFLLTAGGSRSYKTAKLKSGHTHGTGCTFSAAITALTARGEALETAVSRAKDYITRAISEAPGLGRGIGPVNHFAGTESSG